MTTQTEETTTVDEAAEQSVEPGPTRSAVRQGTRRRTVSFRLSTVLTAAAVAVLTVVAIVLGGLYWSAKSDLADRHSKAAGDRHAEQVASNYALGASTIDYKDTKAWLSKLQAGTTPQLAAKFAATGPQLEQILLPLQWTSTAVPLSSSVISEAGGIYKVNAYLNVTSTSAQSPDGVQTTVTYSLTIDRNADWKITDVGGLQNALPAK
ncbi:hypothetical protein [Nocardia tengchongensis]|uniref:hypothetical protein n=1 Tax=Nocardia tengchongensis TaxID=2055889 RepID=UPI00368D45E8